MMDRYVWTHDVGNGRHGGTKATRDCYDIAEEMGWIRFDTTLSGGPATRVRRLYHILSELMRVDRSSTFLLQTPVYGIGNQLIAYFIALRFKTITIIHDIDRLRGQTSNISEHIPRLSQVWISSGKLAEHVQVPPGAGRDVRTLMIWDYLIPDFRGPANCGIDGPVIFAGNLDPGKVSWLYNPTIHRPPLQLYGVNHDVERLRAGDTYVSSFDPDKPRFQEPVGWGLVWDGAKTGTDDAGSDYESINQPHKLSLYLACGIPVIVWAKSHIASFVTERGVGICIENLSDLHQAIKRIDSIQYSEILKSTATISKELRDGNYLKKLL